MSVLVPSWPALLGVIAAVLVVYVAALWARREPIQVRPTSPPSRVPRSAASAVCVPCRVQRRVTVHQQWCDRRASETPIFARLAQEMGLGLALGVAA